MKTIIEFWIEHYIWFYIIGYFVAYTIIKFERGKNNWRSIFITASLSLLSWGIFVVYCIILIIIIVTHIMYLTGRLSSFFQNMKPPKWL